VVFSPFSPASHKPADRSGKKTTDTKNIHHPDKSQFNKKIIKKPTDTKTTTKSSQDITKFLVSPAIPLVGGLLSTTMNEIPDRCRVPSPSRYLQP
jgi:hypothetical protein